MLDGTLVSAGYVLDDLQQNIARKTVVCHLDNDVLWELPLSAAEAPTVEFVPSFVPSVPPTAAQDQPSRFAPKPDLVPEIPGVKVSGEDE
jgi:hypothetical protein